VTVVVKKKLEMCFANTLGCKRERRRKEVCGNPCGGSWGDVRKGNETENAGGMDGLRTKGIIKADKEPYLSLQ
jgi:hypothetical protein